MTAASVEPVAYWSHSDKAQWFVDHFGTRHEMQVRRATATGLVRWDGIWRLHRLVPFAFSCLAEGRPLWLLSATRPSRNLPCSKARSWRQGGCVGCSSSISNHISPA